MRNHSISLLYVTTLTIGEAKRLAKSLLAERLIACANIVGPVTSLFRWKGKMEQAKEYILICKTTGANVSAAKRLIVRLHSYDCPCIVCLPVIDGHKPFLSWIRQSVR